ncbi:MAG: hypothetical protein WC471_05270 [Candidatus Woesearchaeota archaeon]
MDQRKYEIWYSENKKYIWKINLENYVNHFLGISLQFAIIFAITFLLTIVVSQLFTTSEYFAQIRSGILLFFFGVIMVLWISLYNFIFPYSTREKIALLLTYIADQLEEYHEKDNKNEIIDRLKILYKISNLRPLDSESTELFTDSAMKIDKFIINFRLLLKQINYGLNNDNLEKIAPTDLKDLAYHIHLRDESYFMAKTDKIITLSPNSSEFLSVTIYKTKLINKIKQYKGITFSFWIIIYLGIGYLINQYLNVDINTTILAIIALTAPTISVIFK